MKKIAVLFITTVLILSSCKEDSSENTKLDIRINFNANLFHFVDYLSQWSKYCNDDARNFYLEHFELTEEDQEQLIHYASTRDRLHWEEEINLFNWAYEGFQINENTKAEYQELKKVIEYFRKRKNVDLTVEDWLHFRYMKLLSSEKDIKAYAGKMGQIFDSISPYLSIWSENPEYEKYPVYICFSFHPRSSSGGANGDGVYSEFLVDDEGVAIENGFSIITHELTHKVTSMSDDLMDFISNDENYTESAQLFLDENNIDKTALISAFEQYDSLGFGNHEAMVFEEINVYFIAPVSINKMPDERILETYNRYKKSNRREYERIWYGLSLFKKEYESIEPETFDKTEFIWKLIEIYYENVYFENYSGH